MSRTPSPAADTSGAPARPCVRSDAVEADALDPKVHERRWLILAVLCMSLLIIVMDNTILNVAIPSLMTDLGASNSQVQWIVDSYVLVFAGLLLTAGSLSDRFGRKGALQIGIVLFGIGSVAAALSESANQLIFTRAFMGIGGALIMPATLSILTNVFRDPKERGRAIAVWAGFSGLGVAIGPMVGGLLLEHFSWQSVFWVNLPLGITALILGAFLIPTSRDPHKSKLDPIGAVLSFVGLGTLLFGIIEGPGDGWTDPKVLVAFAVAITAIGGFIVWERTTASPMLDLSVFQQRPLQRGERHDHDRVLRPHGVAVPDDAVLAARPRLLAARSRHPPAPLRDDDDGRRADVGPPRRTLRHQAHRADRPHPRDHRSAPAVDDRRRLAVPDGHLVLHDHGRRDGHDDGARHRIGDGRAAP